MQGKSFLRLEINHRELISHLSKMGKQCCKMKWRQAFEKVKICPTVSPFMAVARPTHVLSVEGDTAKIGQQTPFFGFGTQIPFQISVKQGQ